MKTRGACPVLIFYNLTWLIISSKNGEKEILLPFPDQRSGSNGLLSYQSVDLGGHGRR